MASGGKIYFRMISTQIKYIFSIITILIFINSLASGQAAYYIDQIKFTGNTAFSKSELLQFTQASQRRWYHRLPLMKKASQYPRSVLERDALRLTRFYQSEGFLRANVTLNQFKISADKDAAQVQFKVIENEPAIVDSFWFKLENADSTQWTNLKQELEPPRFLKARYREAEIKNYVEQIQTELRSQGFAFAEVNSEVAFHDHKTSAYVALGIAFGEICTFDSVKIEGLQNISPGTLRKEITIEPGQLFDLRQIRETQVNLFQLDLFRYVNVVPDLSTRQRQIPVQIFVKERKQTSLRLGIGYGSEEYLRTMFELKKRSFLGGARILSASGKNSHLGHNLQLNLSQPNFIRRHLTYSMITFYRFEDEPGFNVARRGLLFNLNQSIQTAANLTFNYRIERARLDAPEQLIQQELPFGQTKYVKSVVKGSFYRQNVDRLIDPSQGQIQRISIENSHRLTGKAYEFWKLLAEWRQYTKLTSRNGLAFKIISGLIFPAGKELGVPFEERFFAGGSNSVRSYQRHFLGPLDPNKTPIGGRALFESSVELRNLVYGPFAVVLFYDLGNVWGRCEDMKLVEIQSGFGLGIRIKTPVGPIRADLAFKSLTSRGQFHLSVGQAF